MWATLAAANLASAVVVFRRDDFLIMHAWTTAWLFNGVNLFDAAYWPTDYPPNGIVALSPIALLPFDTMSWLWLFGAMALAARTPTLAARVMRADASREDIAILTLTFLCWSGTRTLLQFSLLPMCLGLAAWRLADRQPWTAGILLGLSLLKPQVALPFCLWVLVTGRWRLVAASVATVAALVGVYCARVGMNPLAVGAGYVSILTGLYTGPARQVGVSELKRLVPEPYTDSWGMVIAVTLFAVVLVTTFVARRRSRADEAIGELRGLPGLTAAAVLLAFRHLSLAFVTLLTASAFLLLDGDASTRARRRPFFWALQAGLIVDLPTAQRQLEAFHVPLGWLSTLMSHGDRVLVLGCFLVLVVCQWRQAPAVPPTSSLARVR